MLIRLSNTTKDIPKDTIENVLKEYDTDKAVEFCRNITYIIPVNSTYPETNRSVHQLNTIFNKNPNVCLKGCLDLNSETLESSISPICSLIVWGYKYVALHNEPLTLATISAITPNNNIDLSNKPITTETIKSSEPLTVTNPKDKIRLPSAPIASVAIVNNEKDTHAVVQNVTKSPAMVKSLDDQSVKQVKPPAVNDINVLPPKTIEKPPSKISDGVSESKHDSSTPPIAATILPSSNEEIFEANVAGGNESQDVINQEIEEEAMEDYSNDPENEPDTESKYIEKIQKKKDKDNTDLIVDANPLKESINVDPFVQETDSNFFTYFMFVMFVCVVGYVFYHNKSKVLALVLEGRRSSGRGGGGGGGLGRKKHTAAYRKLDSNLEEAITSNTSGRTTQIIY
jgi:hypothetical protein